MATKVKSFRINITDDVQEGDAIVIGQNGGMVSCHLGTVSEYDVGTTEGTIPVLGENGQLSTNTMPSSVMKKCIYDPNNKQADVYDYCNLDNAPEIPVVNDPVVTIKQGGVTMGTFSLNQSGTTDVELLAGGVTAGNGIDILNNEVSVDYDDTSIGLNMCDKLEVKDYSTIVSGAAAGATAVQADDLATVAMTGNYCDLINKPEIPSAQIQSDWEQTNTKLPDYIKNKPTIGNATITLQKNGTNVDCFELNQTANKCINLTLSKGDVGLCNVDNTADIDKPISTATQTALNCKQDSITDLNTIRTNSSCGKCAYDTIGNYGDIVSHNVCEFATATQGGKADTAVQPGDLATVATSGKYCDLSGTPALCDVALSGSYNDLVNTPLLCAIATSAKYCDLIGIPVLCNVATTGCYSDLSGTPSLCAVATSGKYCDLTGKPTIPTDNCQLANSCGYTTCTGTLVANDLQPYAKTCELTSYAKCCDLKTVATSGKYCDLTGAPTIPTDNCELGNSCGYTTCTGTLVASDLQPYATTASLCTVATSGKYCDLTGKPTIPTDNCQLANSCGYITNAVNNLTNYYLKCETYKKCEVDNLIANFGGFEVVSTLPTTNIKTNVIYLLGPIGTGDDKYEEWIYYNNTWTKIGETTTDLSNYAKCCDIPTDNCQLGNSCGYTTCTGTLVASDLQPYAKSCDLCTVATSGKYCDLTGKPTIPTDNCQLANSCGYTTCTGNANDSCVVHLSGSETILDGLKVFESNDDPTPNSGSVTTSLTLKGKNLKKGGTAGYKYTSIDFKDKDNALIAKFSGLTTPDGWSGFMAGAGSDPTSTSGNLWLIADNASNNKLLLIPPTTGHNYGAVRYDYYNNNTVRLNNDQTINGTKTFCCEIVLPNKTSSVVNCGTKPATEAQVYSVANSIPTDNCQLANSCGYTTCTGTLVAGDLTPYAKTCDLKTVATSGKYCDLSGTPDLSVYSLACNMVCTLDGADNAHYPTTLAVANALGSAGYGDMLKATYDPCNCEADAFNYQNLYNKPSLCTVATSGKYCDLSGAPTLATVATSGCYNDLTGKPTIPTDNCQLGNGCNYITKDVNNLTCYTPTASLATVATSGAYCDLTGAPTLACVATSGCYDDLSGKPNLGVYQRTCNMVCTLTGADDSHYPTAKTVADALSACGAGDMLKATYDPCNKNSNAFDYNNFINKPSLCPVATSGKYCDLTGTPTIPPALSAGNGINISSNCINVVCDNSSIKKNSSNQLYADFTGLATTSELNNKVSDEIFSSSWNSVTSIAPSKNAVYDKIASMDTAINGKMPGFSLNISHATAGNPREVKFITINYGNMTQYGAAYFKLSATSCHPDGGGYNYMVDIYIGCTYQGVVKCDIIKYIQSSVDQYSPGYEGGGKYFGDVFYVVDTDAKKVYFYILGGQYTSSDFTPAVKIGSTSLTNVQQHSGTGTYYDTGTKVWANGCGSLVAIKSDIPSKTSQLTNDSNYIDNTVNNLTNYTPSSNLAAVATSGKYCDLTDAPIVPAQLTSGTGICIDSNKVNAQNLFIISEDDMCVTYTGEKGVSPYNTSYCYTNVCIDPNSGVKWIEGAQYMFNLNTKVATSDCRNVRLKIGSGDYIPLMGTTEAAAGSSFFVKSSIRPFQYSTKYINTGGLHVVTDSNTTYSIMGLTEGQTGTSTSCRTIQACVLKPLIKYHAVDDTAYASSWDGKTDIAPSKNAVYDKLNTMDTCISCKANTSSLCAVATSGKYCDLTGQPTIPTVGNATITLTQEGNSIGCFTTNSSTATTIDFEYGICYVCCECANCYANCCDNRTYLIYE